MFSTDPVTTVLIMPVSPRARMGHQVLMLERPERNQVKIKKVAAIRPLSQLGPAIFIIVALSVLRGKESN